MHKKYFFPSFSSAFRSCLPSSPSSALFNITCIEISCCFFFRFWFYLFLCWKHMHTQVSIRFWLFPFAHFSRWVCCSPHKIPFCFLDIFSLSLSRFIFILRYDHIQMDRRFWFIKKEKTWKFSNHKSKSNFNGKETNIFCQSNTRSALNDRTPTFLFTHSW